MAKFGAEPFHWLGIKKPAKHGETLAESMVSVPLEKYLTSALVIGATGSGKTNFLHHVIAQHIRQRRSFIVLDPRGDLVSATLNLCAGRVEPTDVALYDLADRHRPTGFNPLKGSGEPHFRCLALIQAIEAHSESWGIQLAETMRYAYRLIADAGDPLIAIDGVFYDREYRQKLVQNTGDAATKAFWRRFDRLGESQQAALAGPVLNKVSLLTSTGPLLSMLGHPRPKNLRKHLDRRGSVTLINLGINNLQDAGRMMGDVMLSYIAREIFDRERFPRSKRNQVTLIIDEFEHFPGPVFESLLVEGRKYRFGTIFAFQTLAQLSNRMRSLILNNVGLKAVFRTGYEDASLLSKSITGSPTGLDIPSLERGECFLWQSGEKTVRFEVNAPLLDDPGSRSWSARTLIQRIKQHNWKDANRQKRPGTKPRPRPDEVIEVIDTKLEDWF